MSRFAALLACYRSGQISEKQWVEHLASDELLRRWIRK
jgi:hypothetical protein